MKGFLDSLSTRRVKGWQWVLLWVLCWPLWIGVAAVYAIAMAVGVSVTLVVGAIDWVQDRYGVLMDRLLDWLDGPEDYYP